jgi:hypothetical protein
LSRITDDEELLARFEKVKTAFAYFVLEAGASYLTFDPDPITTYDAAILRCFGAKNGGDPIVGILGAEYHVHTRNHAHST